MNEPTVTVMVPNLNGARYLPETLESLRRQTRRDFICRVFDGGSTDDSKALVLALGDSRFIWEEYPGAGLAVRQNTAIQTCATPYLARHDADDISTPDRLEKQIRFLEEHRDFIAVFSHHHKFGSRRRYSNADRQRMKAGAFHRFMSERDGCLLISTMMLRIEAARALGGFRQEYYPADDMDWEFRLEEHGPVGVLEEPLMNYRFSDSSASMESWMEMLRKERWTLDSRRRRRSGEPEMNYPSFCDEENKDPVRLARRQRRARGRLLIRQAGIHYLNGRTVKAAGSLIRAFFINRDALTARLRNLVAGKWPGKRSKIL